MEQLRASGVRVFEDQFGSEPGVRLDERQGLELRPRVRDVLEVLRAGHQRGASDDDGVDVGEGVERLEHFPDVQYYVTVSSGLLPKCGFPWYRPEKSTCTHQGIAGCRTCKESDMLLDHLGSRYHVGFESHLPEVFPLHGAQEVHCAPVHPVHVEYQSFEGIEPPSISFLCCIPHFKPSPGRRFLAHHCHSVCCITRPVRSFYVSRYISYRGYLAAWLPRSRANIGV